MCDTYEEEEKVGGLERRRDGRAFRVLLICKGARLL